jgi:flagellar protein FliO/FliZ
LNLFSKYPILKQSQFIAEGGLRLFTGAKSNIRRVRGDSRISVSVFFVCFFCLITPFVSAQEGSESVEAVPETQTTDAITATERAIPLGEGGAEAIPNNPVSVWTILRVLLTLAVVAAAIYGLVYLIKRTSRGNVSKDPFLKILANTQLGVNRGVYVVSVGTQAWLVGSAENGVNLIAEIADKETLDAMLLEESQRTARVSQGNFVDFKALLGKLGVKVDAGTPGLENIRKRSERLKGL